MNCKNNTLRWAIPQHYHSTTNRRRTNSATTNNPLRRAIPQLQTHQYDADEPTAITNSKPGMTHEVVYPTRNGSWRSVSSSITSTPCAINLRDATTHINNKLQNPTTETWSKGTLTSPQRKHDAGYSDLHISPEWQVNYKNKPVCNDIKTILWIPSRSQECTKTQECTVLNQTTTISNKLSTTIPTTSIESTNPRYSIYHEHFDRSHAYCIWSQECVGHTTVGLQTLVGGATGSHWIKPQPHKILRSCGCSSLSASKTNQSHHHLTSTE